MRPCLSHRERRRFNSDERPPDAEAAEIGHLRARAYKDGKTVDAQAAKAATALITKRREREFAKFQEAQDPLESLLNIARDPVIEVLPPGGLDYLMKNYADPRSEEVLALLAQKGQPGGELPTASDLAHRKLIELRAMKEFNSIVDGKPSGPERAAAIVQYLGNRLDLLVPRPPTQENAAVARMCFDELSKSTDPAAAELVLKSGHISPAFALAHSEQMLQYASGISSEVAVSSPQLMERLRESGDKRVIPLFELWLQHTKTEDAKSYLESAIRDLKKARGN